MQLLVFHEEYEPTDMDMKADMSKILLRLVLGGEERGSVTLIASLPFEEFITDRPPDRPTNWCYSQWRVDVTYRDNIYLKGNMVQKNCD